VDEKSLAQGERTVLRVGSAEESTVEGGTPKRQGARRKVARLHLYLQWLTRGVNLRIGYVDLRYGSSFEELADLGQRTDRREVASVPPIKPLLMMLRLRYGQVTHVLSVECVEELHLEPCDDYTLRKQPLQGGGVLYRTFSPLLL
jgi:hypothetical protein